MDRPLFVVIDGLDECDRASRNSLLKLLKTLSQKTMTLKIILSSRPHFEMLERDDVITEFTVKNRLPFLSEDVRALVVEKLSQSAQGSGIWMKMVVELIEARKIRALGMMRYFLAQLPLPGQLSRLYSSLLSRCTSNDFENEQLAVMALKLLAATRRPLSIPELAWAVALGAAQQQVTTIAALAKLVDHERVISLIYLFVARIKFSDEKKRQVRIVHQSVKEFIIKE